MIQLFYGIKKCYRDITIIALTKCIKDKLLIIPVDDGSRAKIFGDPLYGILKHIYLKMEFPDNKIEKIYKFNESINIDLSFLNIEKYISEYVLDNQYDIVAKLEKIHNNIKIEFGNMKEEFPEQLMTVSFLKGNEKVLELGGNIGRNSIIIASLLEYDKNLVTMECDKRIASQLEHNRNINNYHFNIEKSALSYKKLIQKGWDTFPSEILLEGYTNVDIITFEDLEHKYNIIFDTMVIDCEGAFYYILQDNPNILNNIKLIIMENDYRDIEHKNYVDNLLIEKNFENVFRLNGGFGPCYNCFYEVWKQKSYTL